VKVGIASTLKHNLIVGARAFHGNPYDGHTLAEQLEQATILMQDSAVEPATAFVDLGYRGVGADLPGVRIVHRPRAKAPASKRPGCSNGARRLSPSSATAKATTAWTAVTSREKSATGCTRC